ncbi:pyridoxal phosphate-dependent transferase [Infundibulicybe gibba]|nr:pyridoxal phosphate-dependent transferase [Infundibulicybe gibba]
MVGTPIDGTTNTPRAPRTATHPHAISVSLPKWRDNVGYEEGEKRVVEAMVSGYPRFFIHLGIQKLENVCLQKFGANGERCMLFPTQKTAGLCRLFIERRASHGGSSIPVRVIHFLISPEAQESVSVKGSSDRSFAESIDLHILLLPGDAYSIAREFWQHTGMGISVGLGLPPPSPTTTRFPSKVQNKHYSVKGSEKPQPPSQSRSLEPGEELDVDHLTYVEERYGRNMPISSAASAKRALRRRIAGVLIRDSPLDCDGEPCAGIQDLALGPSTRGVSNVSESDVYLFPTGMSAIWNAHHLALGTRPPTKSVCFGFPYTDTLKILQKWGPGAISSGMFPSNPLLRSADLPRIRALADKYDFLIVLPYADMVVSSLTKVFSGSSNVMGGSLVLNPQSPHLDATFEDVYFDEDAVFMERNSRDFKSRIQTIDANAESVCDFLRSRSVAGGSTSAVIKEVCYPKYSTPEHYNHCRIKGGAAGGRPGGYGGLFSLTFVSQAASQAFFDGLSCYKGPSLGTNFTLASPFTILAHYHELSLVRVSVGMEDSDTLLLSFKAALAAAEGTVVPLTKV